MPAVRRPRSTAPSVAMAALGLALCGPASATASYPDGLDPVSLAQWLAQETDLRPAQVVAVSRGSVAGIIAGPEVRDGVTWVTVRLEATAPPTPLPNDVEVLSSQVEVAVDCQRRLVRQGASTGHPGRNLAGTGYIIADQDGDWRFPTVGTQLDAVWRAVCDPNFVHPLAPRPLQASAQPHPRSRRTILVQSRRPKAPAAARPSAAPPKPPAIAASPPPAAAAPPDEPVVVAATSAAPAAVAPTTAPALPVEVAAAPPVASEPPPKAMAAPAPAPDVPQAPPPAPEKAAAAPEAQPIAVAPSAVAAEGAPPSAAASPAPAPAPPVPPDAAPPPSIADPAPAHPPARLPSSKLPSASLNFALRVRLGAFSGESEASAALQRLLARNLSILNGRAAFVGPAAGGHGFAIELAGFEDARAAAAACSVLSLSDGACAVVAATSGVAGPGRRGAASGARPGPGAARP